MEPSNAAMASSPSPSEGQRLPSPEVESQLFSLVFDLSQQVQVAVENMLKMINEIDENSSGIMEEIAKLKDDSIERKRILEEQKENFQKAAFTILEMLNKELG
ncbi:uncharacterized protein LOC127812509 [Diospyros lotus]|uniref:uncharacterized protein LOC127812509 n=1 Tax=Diospyros lotus TaxID=55363 RepID=UPI002258C636|nr:uncharacterized protein LOC127812509 [Diospyros lotus]